MLNTCTALSRTPATLLRHSKSATDLLQMLTTIKLHHTANALSQRFHDTFKTMSPRCRHNVTTILPHTRADHPPTASVTTLSQTIPPRAHHTFRHFQMFFTRHSVTTMHTQSTHKHHTCIILESHFHDTYIALSPRANSHPECANCRHTFTHIHKTFTTLSPNCHRTFTTLTKPHFQHLQTSTAASQSSRSFHHAFSARSPHCHRTSATLPPQFHHTVTTHSPYCHCTSKLPPSYHTLSPHHHRASTHPD